jgi:prophage antirepressor-like protein
MLRSRSPRSRATLSTSDGRYAGDSRYEVTVTGHQLRVVTLDGNPWFVAADVCRVLGLFNPTKAVQSLDKDEVTLTRVQGQRGMPINVISESGLYKLVMRSDKPEARQFQDWVTREVLPVIRKDGLTSGARRRSHPVRCQIRLLPHNSFPLYPMRPLVLVTLCRLHTR